MDEDEYAKATVSCEDAADGSLTGVMTQEPRLKGCVVPLSPDGARELRGCVADEPDAQDRGSVDDDGKDDVAGSCLERLDGNDNAENEDEESDDCADDEAGRDEEDDDEEDDDEEDDDDEDDDEEDEDACSVSCSYGKRRASWSRRVYSRIAT